MSKFLIPDTFKARLLTNGARAQAEEDYDPVPLVKLFLPSGRATWLLTELDPDDPDLAYGLCDLGVGNPEEGEVRLSELQRLVGPGGVGVVRDVRFRTTKPLSELARIALLEGRIVG